MAVVLALADGQLPSFVASSALIATIATESALMIASWARAGALQPVRGGVDLGFCMAALVVGAALTAPRDGFTWANFMYPFTIITSVGIGLTYRRILTVEIMTLLLAASGCGPPRPGVEHRAQRAELLRQHRGCLGRGPDAAPKRPGCR
jgi:hypothetical protein